MDWIEKILEEIEAEHPYKVPGNPDTYSQYNEGWQDALDRVRNKLKCMDGGWIPVEKEWPPFGQRLQATILHHEWVSDYDSAWVPEEEKIHHPAYTEVCEIYPVGELWCYNCSEDDYNGDVAYVEPAKCLSRPVAEIIAWRQLTELYRPERK